MGRSNPELQLLRRLSRRRSVRSDEGSYLVDGPVLLAEALLAGARVRSVYVESDADRARVWDTAEAAAAAGARVREVVPGTLAKVLDLATPQSVVAVVDQHRRGPDEVVRVAAIACRPLLVLVGVADPGNVGTLVRTAEAAGCAGVLLVGECADLYNPKTVRATAGAIFRVPVARCDGAEGLLAALRLGGVRLVGTSGEDGRAPEDVELGGAVALAVGSEAHGLGPEVIECCDHLVTIPMEGSVESLNAAVAGSVLVFEAARQRRTDPASDPSGDPTTVVGHNDRPVASGGPTPVTPTPEHGSATR